MVVPAQLARATRLIDVVCLVMVFSLGWAGENCEPHHNPRHPAKVGSADDRPLSGVAIARVTTVT